jgi:hypothetical protein
MVRCWVVIDYRELFIQYKCRILCLYSYCVSITNVFPMFAFVMASLFVIILFFHVCYEFTFFFGLETLHITTKLTIFPEMALREE